MIIAGVMSGTSADGVDVAICRISPGKDPASPRIRLLGLVSRPYPAAIRETLLNVMAGASLPAAEMSRLNWRLGEVYGACVAHAAERLKVKPALIGLHGQTIHHETTPTKALGAKVRSTWQMGEAAVVAERMHCPVVSDLRPADLAAGGEGAPLVPMLDWCLFRSPRVSRVLQNIGGIGNLTAISAGAGAEKLLAFDTGPGNMVIDFCMAQLFDNKFDRNGATARRGTVLPEVVSGVLREPYFSALPPKSCGREEFGAAFATRFMESCRRAGGADSDVIATATAITAESIVDAYRRFVWSRFGQAAPLAPVEFVVAGGGARNSTLMSMLTEGLGSLGVTVRDVAELGIPAQAKEGVAFALLAWLTWHGLPGNVPSATGAAHPAILGKVSYG